MGIVKPNSRRWAGALATSSLAAMIVLAAGAPPAAATWSDAPYSKAPSPITSGACSVAQNSSEATLAGDFYGVAVNGTTTVAVGDDCEADSASNAGAGQISTMGGSHTLSFQQDFNNVSPANLKDPSLANYSLEAVSCPTTSFCMAVGGEGVVLVFNGVQWSSYAQVDAPNTLTSVSCPTASFCAAVDSAGRSLVCTSGTVCTSPSKWTITDIDGTTALVAVSCTSSSYCLAIDKIYGMAYNGTGWSSPHAIDGTTYDMTSVSCVSATPFCMAVNGGGYSFDCSGANCTTPTLSVVSAVAMSYPDDSVSCASSSYCIAVDNAGNAYSFGGSSWSSGTNIDSSNILASISCPTSSFCVAVDGNANAIVDSSGTWSAPSPIDGSNALTSVSCVSSSYCWVVDSAGNAVEYDTNPWRLMTGVDTGNSLIGVSCVSNTDCVAADNTTSDATYLYDGASWSKGGTINNPYAQPLTAVSCSSTTFCMAGDNYDDLFIYDGSQWTYYGYVGASPVTSISCPSTTFCEVVDNGGSGTSYGYDLYYSNGWYYTAHSFGRRVDFTSVSCASTTLCVVVSSTGNYEVRTGSPGSPSWTASNASADSGSLHISCPAGGTWCMAVDNSGKYETATSCGSSGCTWSGPTSTGDSHYLESVSCVSSSWCMAVDSSGNALIDSGGSWSVNAEDGTNTLNSVSCVSSSFCAAVDNAGNALIYEAQSWAPPAHILAVPAVNGTSCVSATFCMSIDSAGDAHAYDGVNWKDSPPNSWTNPIDGANTLSSVSCASTSFCVAVDSGGNELSYTGGATWASKAIDPGYDLAEVSCASTSFCVVLESSYYYLYYSGGTWSGYTATGDSAVFRGLSCPPGGSFCMAIDSSGNSVTCGPGGSSCTGGTAWTVTATGDANTLEAVACASSSFCTIVDSKGDYMVSSNGGASWSAPSAVASGTTTALTSVSCTSSTFCAAVDAAGNAYTFDGSTWSPAPSNPVDPYQLTSISCVPNGATEFCAAGDSEGNELTSYELTTGPLFAVSCPATNQCVAVGTTTTDTGLVLYSTSPSNAGSWLSEPLPSGTGPLFAVSCPTASVCYAAGDVASGPSRGGVILESTDGGQSWSSQSLPSDPTVTGLAGIYCLSSSECFAVGEGVNGGLTDGAILHVDSSPWGSCSAGTWCLASYTSSTGSLAGIDCTTAPVCFASGDGGGYPYVYWNGNPTGSPSTWNGQDNTSQAGNSYLYGVTCLSTIHCYAYGWAEVSGSPEATIWQNTSFSGSSQGSWTVELTGSPTDNGVVPTAWFAMACAASSCTVVGSNNASTYYPMAAYGS